MNNNYIIWITRKRYGLWVTSVVCRFLIEFVYVDEKKKLTRSILSPINFKIISINSSCLNCNKKFIENISYIREDDGCS